MQYSCSEIWELPTTRQFAEAISGMSDMQTLQNFLRDVMTEKEILEISARLEAARMLQEGKKYTEVIEATKLSSRTVARISDWMQNGQGGYEAALKIVGTRHTHLPPARA